MEDLLQVGIITSTHGVRGEVKVYPTTDDPRRFRRLKEVVLDTGRESEASREMLADIREIFDRTKQIEGVHTVNIYENVTPRPNRHDLMIEMEMAQEALPVYDDSAAHQEWKAKYGEYIQTKTIFDYE